MSVSWWRREQGGNDAFRCDVCVIGGGIAGLAAADEAARLGRSVALLERHSLGWGASTRNAGYLMRGTAESYAAAVREHGRDRARETWRLSEQNLAMLIDRYAIDDLPSFRRVPSSLVPIDHEQADELRASARLLAEDGFDVVLEQSGDDSLWRSLRPPVALVNPNDAAVNPAELLARMAQRARQHAGLRVYEHAEVFSLRWSGDGVEAVSDGVTVQADRLLVCVNAYASELVPGLASRVRPNRGQMLALRHPTARLDRSYYLDRGSEYIRQTADGVIVVGGMRKRFAEAEQTTDDAPTPKVQAALERFASEVLSGRGEVLARWAGTMGFTDDGLPLVEPIPLAGEPGDPARRASSRALFCGGFTGHGMSIGAITAAGAMSRLLGVPTGDDAEAHG